MRIWLQSNAALRSDPRWAAYTRSIEARMAGLARPGTELRLEGTQRIEKSHQYSAFARYGNLGQVLDCGIQAENEGYDAFVVIGMTNAGCEELRDRLKIAVVYSEAVAWSFAAWQYRRFGLLAHEGNLYFRRVEQIREHGALELFVPGDYADVPEKDILAAFDNPGPLIETFKASAARAVRDGARVLIPDFNVLNDLLITAGVREFHGVPIMDTAGLALKAAEMVVDARRVGVL